jgi:serine protease AprX
MARITINGVSLDPASSVPLVAALATADASHSDYVLVQSNAPLTEQQKGQLDGAGFKIGEYVSEDTYLRVRTSRSFFGSP